MPESICCLSLDSNRNSPTGVSNIRRTPSKQASINDGIEEGKADASTILNLGIMLAQLRREFTKLGESLTASFLLQQFRLAIDAPTITRQCAIAADHAMAGHHDRHGIGGTRARDGSNRTRFANFLGYVAVAARLAPWNSAQRIPNFLLERRCANVERHIHRDLRAANRLQHRL